MKNLSRETSSDKYAQRLIDLQERNWKKKLSFLNPYRYHISKVCHGNVLEVGCGIGRVLEFIPNRSVGVDHNKKSISEAKAKGLNAYHSQDFLDGDLFEYESFDTLLFSHVLEHMSMEEAKDILSMYLPYLKNGGRVVLITPQEKGQKSDETHVTYMSQERLSTLALSVHLVKTSGYSFPFPSFFSSYFIYNEHVFIGVKS